MNMTITGINSNVQAILNGTQKFTTVLSHPLEAADQFAGYPAAAHYYVDSEDDYATVSQNRAVYQYVVEVYVSPPADTTSADKYSAAYSLLDEIISTFRKTRNLADDSLSITRACDRLRPSPSTFEPVDVGEGKALRAVIRLYCESDVAFL